MQYAVDQEAIVDHILDGVGTPARGPFSPAIEWSAHEDLPPYGPDIERVRELVGDSTYEGQDTTIILRSGNPTQTQIAEMMQQSFDDVEVSMSIEEALQTWDDKERYSRYHDIQLRVMEMSILIPLFYKEHVLGKRRDISGPTFHAIPRMTDWTTMSRK